VALWAVGVQIPLRHDLAAETHGAGDDMPSDPSVRSSSPSIKSSEKAVKPVTFSDSATANEVVERDLAVAPSS
jgi:hypothetical protein